MCLNLSLIALKVSNCFLSESIVIKSKQNFFSIAFVFLFCSQYFCCCAHFYQFLLQAYSHENTSQSYNLKHYIVFVYFLLQINSCTDCCFVKMTYYLNPNLVLNLCVDVVLQSIFTLIANFSSIKALLHYFLVSFIRFSAYINHNHMICSTKFFISSFISHLVIFSYIIYWNKFVMTNIWLKLGSHFPKKILLFTSIKALQKWWIILFISS